MPHLTHPDLQQLKLHSRCTLPGSASAVACRKKQLLRGSIISIDDDTCEPDSSDTKPRGRCVPWMSVHEDTINCFLQAAQDNHFMHSAVSSGSSTGGNTSVTAQALKEFAGLHHELTEVLRSLVPPFG